MVCLKLSETDMKCSLKQQLLTTSILIRNFIIEHM